MSTARIGARSLHPVVLKLGRSPTGISHGGLRFQLPSTSNVCLPFLRLDTTPSTTTVRPTSSIQYLQFTKRGYASKSAAGPAQPASPSPLPPSQPTDDPSASSSDPPEIPAKLLIYYAGKRTLPLALIKLSTLFLFTTGILITSISVTDMVFGTSLVSDSSHPVPEPENEGEVPGDLAGTGDSSASNSTTPTTTTTPHLPPAAPPKTPPFNLTPETSLLLFFLLSTTPFLLLFYISPPYTTHIYLHLPPWARSSPKHLEAFITKLPATAEMDFVTMAWSGRPVVARKVKVNELEWLGGVGGKEKVKVSTEGGVEAWKGKKARRLGCANLVWRETDSLGRWRAGRERGLFYVNPGGRLARTPLEGQVPAGEGVVAKIVELTREREGSGVAR